MIETSNSKKYPLTDPAALAAKIKQLNGPAIDPAQPTGETTEHGVHLSWVVADGVVTITVVSKPFFVPYSTIFNELSTLFVG